MGDFEQLNSMILMNMEKIIDKKLNLIKQTNQYVNASDNRTMCDYCG